MPRIFLAVLLLCACATAPGADPLNLAAMQRRLDDRGMGFGLTRVPGEDAVLFQVRFRGADAGGAEEATPGEAALAAAPHGCQVASVTAVDETTFRAEYAC